MSARMNAQEWRATAALSLIQALRMLGMFMILPVISLYARDLGATTGELALVMGSYALTQAVLQIPFGILSDHIGRKTVIVGGLIIFAIGSYIAGATHDIHWVIFGRAIQGAGAVSGAVSALLADTTRVQVRTQAMALMGAGMGVSFIIALILGSPVSGWIGVQGIFVLTAVMALVAIPIVLFVVPKVPRGGAAERGLLEAVIDPQLLRLNGGIFLLHTMMTALFIAAPRAIEQTLGLNETQQWRVYLPVLLISVIPVFPLIRRIEASGRVKPAFIGSILLLGGALLAAAHVFSTGWALCTALLVFFIGFNYLEGTLPSLISRRAPPDRKGAALGIYASSQFLGGFAGAQLGAHALALWGIGGVFAAAAVMSLIWLTFAAGIQPVTHPPSIGASSSA